MINYLYKKYVDWSLFKDGFNIPVNLQIIFHEKIGKYLKKGESKNIKLLLDGEIYDALLVNIHFDQLKYPNHKELLQIRYSYNSPIAQKLRAVFRDSYEFVIQEKEKQTNKRAHIKMPDDPKEFLSLYMTDDSNVFYLEAVTRNDYNEIKSEINEISEDEFETYSNIPVRDECAGIIEKKKLVKIRRLDRSISDNLKVLYDFRCQITGVKFGEMYGSEVSEAHHIEPFTKSLNNDSNNIIILSPNYHRLIHKAKPIFDRKKLVFIFPNGIEEHLIINKHL